MEPDFAEPDLVTEPRLRPVLKELMAREPLFHRPDVARTRGDFENMMDAGFWEVGASGRRYSREYVLDILEERLENPLADEWRTKDAHCREIGAGHYLLTYTLLQGSRVTRRTTLWHKTARGWQALFHQGTIVQEE